MWEAEIGRITVPDQPRQKYFFHEKKYFSCGYRHFVQVSITLFV
jgi:hypothetical protein